MQILNSTYELVDTADLIVHPRNPNEGDIGAIVESIKSNGFYGAIVAQRSTRYVLAGNHRLQAATLCGIERVPVTWVECDERTALKILLADNRTGELAQRNVDALATLLYELARDDDMRGTGYDEEDLEGLLQDLEAPLDLDDVSMDGSQDGGASCPQCGYPI